MNPARDQLFYDGHCGMCTRSARWIRRLDWLRAGAADEHDLGTESIQTVRRSKSQRPYLIGAASILLVLGVASLIWFATRKPKEEEPKNKQAVVKKNEPPKVDPVFVPGGQQPIDLSQLGFGANLMPDPNQMLKMFENHPFLRKPEQFPRIDPIADNPLFRNPDLLGNLFQQFGVGAGASIEQPGWMANSSDGKLIAIPVGGRVAIIGQQMPDIEAVPSRIQCLAISPDNRWLIGGCESKSDNLVRWDLKTGKRQPAMEGHRGEVNSIAFGPASRFVTTSNDGTARVWTITGRAPTITFNDHQDFVRCAIFLPGPMRVASGGDDKVVRIWETTQGKTIKELKGHTAPIRCIAVSPSGKVLATGSDRELKLWNAETFEEFLTETTPAGWLAFAPDNLSVFTAGCDHSQGTVHQVTVWNTRDWGKRKSYDLKSRGGQAVYHLSADGGVLFGNRSSAIGGSLPVSAYRALSGEQLSK